MKTARTITDGERQTMLAEFAALRDEIMRRAEIQHQLLSLAILSAGAIFAAGMQTKHAVIVLAYPMIALFIAVNWSVNDRRSRQLGAYIRVRLEPHLGLGWERYYSTVPNPKFFFGTVSFRPSYAASRGMFIGTEAIALVLGITISGEPYDLARVSALILAAVATALTPFMLIRDQVPAPSAHVP